MTHPLENPPILHWAGEIAIFAAIAWSITTAVMATIGVFYGRLAWTAIPSFVVPQITVAIYALLAQREQNNA